MLFAKKISVFESIASQNEIYWEKLNYPCKKAALKFAIPMATAEYSTEIVVVHTCQELWSHLNF